MYEVNVTFMFPCEPSFEDALDFVDFIRSYCDRVECCCYYISPDNDLEE